MLPFSLAKAEDWSVARQTTPILAGQRACHSNVTPGAVNCSRPDAASRKGPGTRCATRRTGHARPRSRPGLTRTRRRVATRRGLTARAPARRVETGRWPGAGAWPDGTRPGPAPRPESEPWPEARQWPERGQWRPWPTPADRASTGYRAGQVPQATGPYDAVSFRPENSECPTDSQIAGAPAALGPRSPGRFDAEWSPKGAKVRRNSLLRRRRRAGGGAMVRKATLDRGLRPEELVAAAEAVRGAPE